MNIEKSDGNEQTGGASRVPPTNPIGRNVTQHESPTFFAPDERTSQMQIESRTAAQPGGVATDVLKVLWRTCGETFHGAWWVLRRVLNALVPPTLKNCTVDDVELMSEENKRMLLRDASTEDLQGLIARDKQVFLQLFDALGPEDVVLKAKCFKCFRDIPELQDLSGAFLREINEYLPLLKKTSLRALSLDSRRTLLESASPDALEQLIRRDKQVFLQLFIALRAEDRETIEKCSPFLSETEALLLQLQDSMQAAIGLNPLEANKFLGSCKLWQAMGVTMASFCFDESGKVNMERVAALKLALMDQGSFFYQEPCSNVPGIELIRTQAARVLGSPELFLVLDNANSLEPNDYGQQVLSAMPLAGQSPLKLNTAVLASLLSPHRQTCLPTCTINSIMNADIHNNPAVPARMLMQILATGTTHTPSGYVLRSPPIKDGSVAIDSSRGLESATKIIFDPNRVGKWAIYGIRRDEENGNILLPIFDANDVLFAAYFQASLFGNRGLEGHGSSEFGTMLMRHGIKKSNEVYLNSIAISDSSRSMDIAIVIKSMQSLAEERRAAGESCNYVRISTKGPLGGHAENIDVDALLKLDLSRLEKDKPHIIGDRNHVGDKNHEIIGFPEHFAVVKTSDLDVEPPTYRFASVYFDGKPYEWDDITKVYFYATEVKPHESRPWRVDEAGAIVYEPDQAAPV